MADCIKKKQNIKRKSYKDFEADQHLILKILNRKHMILKSVASKRYQYSQKNFSCSKFRKKKI